MLTMHPTVLIGPSDWDAATMPQEEFRARIAALIDVCGSPAGLVVYGDQRNHAELVYLTNFLPKLDQTVALIPRTGEPRVLYGGGPSMIGAAKPLTWIADLAPLRGGGEAIGKWLREVAAQGGAAPVMIGGDYMPSDLRHAIVKGVGAPVADATARLHGLMRRKSAREMACVREACGMLNAVTGALDAAFRRGASAVAAVLDAEGTAIRSGAQDVRVLFSMDGGRTLRPFEKLDDRRVDPLQAYLAVRHAGYWAEGFVCLSANSNPLADKAAAALKTAIALVRSGAKVADVANAIGEAAGSLKPHPVTAQSCGNAIGLSLDEGPRLMTDSVETMQPGDIYSVRAGLADERGGAILSAMVAVTEHGSDILWSAQETA